MVNISLPLLRLIWRFTLVYRHTSVVVFGKEIFYGQGISITLPGRTHVRRMLWKCGFLWCEFASSTAHLTRFSIWVILQLMRPLSKITWVKCGSIILQIKYANLFFVTASLLTVSQVPSTRYTQISVLNALLKQILSLDFNCNSFTNDCVGFLTGGSIPSWIKGKWNVVSRVWDLIHHCSLRSSNRLSINTLWSCSQTHDRPHVSRICF